MKHRRAWLSRQRDGNYIFSIFPAKLVKVFGSDFFDFYIQEGEPIGLRYWCPMGVKAFFGVELEIGQQCRVWVLGGKVQDYKND